MLKIGQDPLQEAIDCCHARPRVGTWSGAVDILVSFRMNDNQDIAQFHRYDWTPFSEDDPPYFQGESQRFLDNFEYVYQKSGDPYFPRWKLRHPECLLGGRYLAAVLAGVAPPYDPALVEDSDPRYRWHAKDYASPLVRDNTLIAIRDVCKNYAVDGVELDFLKLSVHFSETFSPAPTEVAATKVDDLTTHLISAARNATRTYGKKLAVRVPENAIQSRFIGLDVERWLRDGLIDLLIVGTGHAPRNNSDLVRDMVALAAPHGVPVYAAIAAESPPFTGLLTTNGQSDDALRGRATWRATSLNIRSAGAGVYTFNLFPDDTAQGQIIHYSSVYDAFNDIGSEASCLSGVRRYGLDILHGDGFGAVRRYFSRMAQQHYSSPTQDTLPSVIEQPTLASDDLGTNDAEVLLRVAELNDCGVLYRGNSRMSPRLDASRLPDALPRIVYASWK